MERAFTTLRGYARAHNQRLSDVARAFVVLHGPDGRRRCEATAAVATRMRGPLHRSSRVSSTAAGLVGAPRRNCRENGAEAAHSGDAAPAGLDSGSGAGSLGGEIHRYRTYDIHGRGAVLPSQEPRADRGKTEQCLTPEPRAV